MKQKATILLIDDQQDILFSLKMLLKQHYTQVFAENNPYHIPRLLNQYNPDVVLLDMNFKVSQTKGEEGIKWLQKIKELKKDIKLIDNNVRDIKAKLTANPKANAAAREESQKIIEAFQEEKGLRQSKIDFYDLCLSKFNQIIKNHQLAEDLKVKREKLAALKENNIDEVADMEGMKTFIDYEKEYIETIDELSLRMLKSRSIEKAEALQLELVEMTRELREL